MKKNTKQENKRNILVYILLIISLLFLYSFYIEPNNLKIKEYKIENKNIPTSYDGLKLVHFSDVHYGSTVDLKYLKKIIKIINKQKPHIVVFTGDFLDKRYDIKDKEIENIKKELKKLQPILGNYVVSGNHDIVHEKDFKNLFSESFTLLENEEKLIYYNDTTPISIVGLSDSSETKIDYKVFEKENSFYRIVLAHEPDEYEKIKEYNFNILLSGHSHNGQVRIPFIGKLYTPIGAKKYYEEHYKIDDKEIFISNGIGTSTFNLRFNSTPSINIYRFYAY